MINVSDPNNDILSYQWYLDEEIVGENKNSYTFTANNSCSGTFNIRVVVSDGEFITNHTWNLTVINIGNLENSIQSLQNQIEGLTHDNTVLQSQIENLTSNLIAVWAQLNETLTNNTQLQNLTVSLQEMLNSVWEQLNQTLSNNTSLQEEISRLEQENQELKNQTGGNKNQTGGNKTPWLGAGETVIIISLVCIMVLIYRKKKIKGEMIV